MRLEGDRIFRNERFRGGRSFVENGQRHYDWLEVQVVSESDAAFAVALIHDAVVANLPTAPPGLPPTGTDLERRRRFH